MYVACMTFLKEATVQFEHDSRSKQLRELADILLDHTNK